MTTVSTTESPAPRARGIGRGLDVSGVQGAFPWSKWAGRIDFAGIRITSWTSGDSFAPDPDLEHNASHTWSVFGGRIPRLYYHFARPGLHDPHRQARLAREALGGHLCHGDLIVDDMEEDDGESPAFVARWHRRFLDGFNRLAGGHRVLAYCNVAWAEAGNCEGLEAWGLWLADWSLTGPPAPHPWSRWEFQQTAGTSLDRDVFRGTQAQLLDYCRMPAWRRAPAQGGN